MMARLLLWLFLGLVTLARLYLVAGAELSATEAYWALCGWQPAVAYFDGPGGTPLAVAAGVAWGAAGLWWPIFALLATLALFFLVAPLAGSRAALAVAVLLNLLPAFNTNAVTPGDAMPLTMFALGFMAAAWRGLHHDSTSWWLGAGFCAAGGLLFSYQAWFLLPALGIVLLASRRWRSRLVGAGFWLAAVPPLVVLGMLLSWNASHDWIHFIRGTWQTALDLQWWRLPGSLWRAAGAASPLSLAVLAAALVFALREISVAPKAKFLVVPALFALLVTGYAVLRGEPAQPAGLMTAALALPLMAWLPASAGRLPARLLLLLVFLTTALWSAAQMARSHPVDAGLSAEVGREIEKLRSSQTSPIFLIAEDAPLASAIALHLQEAAPALPGHPPVYVIESPSAESQYAFWPRYDQFTEAPATPPEPGTDPYTEQDGFNPFLGRSALYLTTQAEEELPQAISAAFANCRLLAEITLPSEGILRVFLCSEYQTLPL
jgi:4-amino-4-deoxy-L-arabinose transferase-like glycosyltransferase